MVEGKMGSPDEGTEPSPGCSLLPLQQVLCRDTEAPRMQQEPGWGGEPQMSISGLWLGKAGAGQARAAWPLGTREVADT